MLKELAGPFPLYFLLIYAFWAIGSVIRVFFCEIFHSFAWIDLKSSFQFQLSGVFWNFVFVLFEILLRTNLILDSLSNFFNLISPFDPILFNSPSQC